MLNSAKYPLMRHCAQIALILLAFVACSAAASESLKVPRFVSTKSDDTNLRTGPGARYPIKWIHRKKSMPVEIIEEYEHWRKIRDVDGEWGWVHKSLLSSKRYVFITAKYAVLRNKPEPKAPLTLKLGHGVLAQIDECTKDWCELSHERGSGWAMKKDFWGAYPDEVFN